MPQIKIVKPGFHNYTGQMGLFMFEDGVSEDMSVMDAERFGGVMRCVLVNEDGEVTDQEVSPLNRLSSIRSVKAPMSASRKVETKVSKVAEAATPATPSSPKTTENPSYDFNEESLNALIDSKGIKGLRSIADRFDVRGKGVMQIRDTLLAKKAEYEALVAKDAPAPDVKAEEPVVDEPVVDEPVDLEDLIDDEDDSDLIVATLDDEDDDLMFSEIDDLIESSEGES